MDDSPAQNGASPSDSYVSSITTVTLAATQKTNDTSTSSSGSSSSSDSDTESAPEPENRHKRPKHVQDEDVYDEPADMETTWGVQKKAGQLDMWDKDDSLVFCLV